MRDDDKSKANVTTKLDNYSITKLMFIRLRRFSHKYPTMYRHIIVIFYFDVF